MNHKPTFLSHFTPSLMSYQALEEIFIQREDLLRQTLEQVRKAVGTGIPAYRLFVGPRGIGKTHLISMLYYRLKAMKDMGDSLVIAWMREEEWRITSFRDLLLRILHVLATEEESNPELEKKIESLYNMTPEMAESGAAKLLHDFVGGRSLIVLVENLDDLFQRLGRRQDRLRRFLQENSYCSVLATSQTQLDAMSTPGVSFHDIFHFHRLEELDHEEAAQLLSKIAAYRGDRELAAFLTTSRGMARIRALRYLAGGNHRAYVIFSQFLSRDSLDELIEPLMRTIDDLTPYYQSRMAWLSQDQRKIVAYICEHRRPSKIQDIAKHCFLKPGVVSTHLDLLQKMGYLGAITVGTDRYYELREPLMRLSIEVKKHRGKPVQLLIDFLRLWYSPAELQQRLAVLPPDASLEREYVLPAIQTTKEEDEDPRVAGYCREYSNAVKEGDTERALKAAEELVAIRGSSRDLFVQASCLKSLGRYEQAVSCYESVLALNADDPEAWLQRGSALITLGDYQEALSSCDQALELDPGSADAWKYRGTVLLQTGQAEKALASFERALELNSDNSSTWLSRGMALTELACYEEASTSFAKAAKLEPDQTITYLYWCAALIELRKFEQALACTEKALQLNAEEPAAWTLKGITESALKHHQDALASLNHAIELGESSSLVCFKRGQVLLAQDLWRDGISALDEALGRFAHGDNPEVGSPVELVRLLQNSLPEEKGLQLRMKALFLLYYKHKVLTALGQGIVECIPDLFSSLFDEALSRRWFRLWQELAGDHPELKLPLRLLESAVSYRQIEDPKILMELPLEERLLLEPLLGVKLQVTA